MSDVIFVFEVHQPYRLRKDFFWGKQFFKHLYKKELFNYYFDDSVNREIFQRASRKCYFPSNQILLDLIDKHKSEKKKVKVSFSLSGVFLEQCEKYNKNLLETFKQLAETRCVEFLSQTYHHSLASLFPEKEEFILQLKAHQRIMKDLLSYSSKVFENTELLYNNAIQKLWKS